MSRLDFSREGLALIVIYLEKAEARDNICRAIEYGSKFLSGGRPGTAYNVDYNTTLARKVFRLLKFLYDFQHLISPVNKETPNLLLLLRKSKHALSSAYFYLDQFVWLGRSGIYKSKALTELIERISFFCCLGSCICSTAVQILELGRLSSCINKMGNELKDDDENNRDNKRILPLVKSSMDVITTIGLLKLAPWIVTTRVTGAFGFTASLIACYQLLPPRLKFKKPLSQRSVLL